MKIFFSNGISFITLAALLLLSAGWAQAGVTTRVNVDSAGNQVTGSPGLPSISADGRFVAFYSDASNLVAGDTNGTFDIFVRDRQTGATTRVNVDSAGNQANGSSFTSSISADGRFVAFDSGASNLVAGDTNGKYDIFMHDRQTGTTRVSVDSAGNGANSYSYDPSLSADGRFVAFSSFASNLVAGDTNNTDDVFVHDRQTGATTRVSVNSAGGQGNNPTYYSSISADGRFVAFTSRATNLVAGDTNNTDDVFVHDRQTGATTRVSMNSAGGQANGFSQFSPSLSADGRFVAFQSRASNLVAGDTNSQDDIFVHDRQTGTTTRVSVDSAGNQAVYSGSLVIELVYGSNRPKINADGRFVVFQSDATNLVSSTYEYDVSDVFMHDRQTGATTLVSVDSTGGAGNFQSSSSSLSADGRIVAFYSYASNLVADDTNNTGDIFVHQSCDQDADCDGTPDPQDNCLYVANGPTTPDVSGLSQRDTNGDGYGNVCDPDLNNDGLVTAADYMILRRRLNTADPDADLNGDGLVTILDYRILRGLLSRAPGPSGLVP